MKIALESIPEEGIELQLAEKEPILEEAMGRIPSMEDVEIRPWVTGKLRIDPQEEDFLLTAGVTGLLTLTCSRCLRQYGMETSIQVAALIRRGSPTDDLAGAEDDLDEQDTHFVDSDTFDPGPVILQELLLEIPMKPLCTDDCPGLCRTCGEIRNSEACECPREETTDPRWAALADLKKRMAP
jgi:uncharacterized protein